MKKLISTTTALFASALLITGCTQEGPGGTSEIHVTVEHHSTVIPFAKVYIKYGVRQSPGTDVTAYDDSITTDASAQGHFQELEKGDYYLYSAGFDSTINQAVDGGVPVKVKAGEVLDTDVPVTED